MLHDLSMFLATRFCLADSTVSSLNSEVWSNMRILIEGTHVILERALIQATHGFLDLANF